MEAGAALGPAGVRFSRAQSLGFGGTGTRRFLSVALSNLPSVEVDVSLHLHNCFPFRTPWKVEGLWRGSSGPPPLPHLVDPTGSRDGGGPTLVHGWWWPARVNSSYVEGRLV